MTEIYLISKFVPNHLYWKKEDPLIYDKQTPTKRFNLWRAKQNFCPMFVYRLREGKKPCQ